MLDFSKFSFNPIIKLPETYLVLDFTKAESSSRNHAQVWTIGRYNEERVNIYRHDLFQGRRNIHVGIDIGAPAKTEISSFYDGTILYLADNTLPGDYGPTLVTEHDLDGVSLFALYGHLTRQSLLGKSEGQKIYRGEVIGYVGESHENGGWPPHVHFQLSFLRPIAADMPGVVSKDELSSALNIYPDPRLVLGKIY